MENSSQNSNCKNFFDTANGSLATQTEESAPPGIKPKDSGGAVKKKKSGGSKAKKEFNNSSSPGVLDGRTSRSKGGNKQAAKSSDSAFSETPKHKKSSRRVVASSDTSDMYSDFSAKMNSSDNMRNVKQKKGTAGQSSNAVGPTGSSSFNFSPSGKDSNTPRKKDAVFRSKTPDYKGTMPNKPNSSVRKSNSFKKPMKFEPYIPLFQVQQGLKRGEFIEGALRINPRSYEDAYVSSPDGKMDIYIGGMHDRNRALNGDQVVVQINPKQEWKVLCDAIKDYQEKSGESVMDAVCQPVPSPPCKVHTPDKFQRSRPVSSNSWGSSACGERHPDTVEILGLDKLAKQLNDLVVGGGTSNSKRKRRPRSHYKGTDKNSGVCSQESSEDCLDKYSPSHEQYVPSNSSLHQDSQIVKMEGLPVVSKTDATYPVCDMNDIGTFDVDPEQNRDPSQAWEADESSLNIIVSPEELLSIDGDSLLDPEYISKLENYDSGSEVEGIIVAPGDLSGDEFTDSASIESSHSQSLNQIIEDAAFLACQQDADNNNVVLENNYNDNILSRYSTDYPVVVSTRSVELECKMQHNNTVPPLSCIEVGSNDIVCAAVLELPLSKDHSSSDENINTDPLSIGQFHAVDHVNDMDKPTVKTNKKSRRRRRKKKNDKKEETVNLNLKKTDFGDVSQLTVEDLLKHNEWPRFVQKTGKVVHILERKHSCIAAGHLKLCQDKNPKWALFSPNDSRVPRVMIPMSDCPPNFYNRPHDYAKVLFLAQIVEWNDTSTFASGHLIRSLGNSGDVETETCGILTENGVDDFEFPVEVLDCLPQDENWKVPLKEIKKRKDFRKQCVFTIDPATARDMDDAVSCTRLDNGNYEVGVHIADVTYFVEEGTPLDTVAQSRSTSVYLVQKVVPMLPRLLCDNLCSLNPGKDRLTFSVVWEMTPNGGICRQWIGRSVINSCVKLSYEHAQSMIESTGLHHFDAKEYPEMYGLFTLGDVAKRVRELQSLALKLREMRFISGALKLDQVKLQFTLDKESGLPSGFKIYEQKDSNRLIEEFMLLANMSVARQIYEAYPSLALLRRHPEPKEQVMNDIVSMCESMGIILDASSSGALQNSIAKYQGEDYLSRARAELLMNLCSRPMNCALYFCTGVLENPAMFRHYALNVPLYTHFTSPIRRYPDVLVHRLLGASLGYGPPPLLTPQTMEASAKHCNDKKYSAKRVSDMSDEMFLAAFIREIGSVGAKAMVLGVMDHSFDCLVLEMGIVKRVYCNQLPLLDKKFKRSQGVSTLNIFWKDSGLEQVIVIFALVDVVLTVERETLQIKVVLKMPDEL